MTLVFKLAMAVSIMATSTGCQQKISGGSDLEHATVVTSSEFKEAMQQQPVFFWIGFDEESHYCIAEDGFYRITDGSALLPPNRRAPRMKRGDEGFGTRGVFFRLKGDHIEPTSDTPEILGALKRHLGEKHSKTN